MSESLAHAEASVYQVSQATTANGVGETVKKQAYKPPKAGFDAEEEQRSTMRSTVPGKTEAATWRHQEPP